MFKIIEAAVKWCFSEREEFAWASLNQSSYIWKHSLTLQICYAYFFQRFSKTHGYVSTPVSPRALDRGNESSPRAKTYASTHDQVLCSSECVKTHIFCRINCLCDSTSWMPTVPYTNHMRFFNSTVYTDQCKQYVVCLCNQIMYNLK